MLSVKTAEEVFDIIEERFEPLDNMAERVGLRQAAGRILAEDIRAEEYVPDFDRSTVDGYAIKAADSFGCSESIPAILPVQGRVLMGKRPDFTLAPGSCCQIPTGGALPEGADCAVMLEHTEDYGDGSIGVLKPAAPGLNLIYRGDDVSPGQILMRAGRTLRPQDIGALAAMGITEISVKRRLRIALISTGDELVPPEEKPGPGQVRDVNGPAIEAMLKAAGAEVLYLGIVKDDEALLAGTARHALAECDGLIMSGGSSVGVKDAACRIIESMGELLFHGIAIKPGKPTILGVAGNKPIVGLPGHPAAACIITRLFVLPLMKRLWGAEKNEYSIPAYLSENVGANHGRSEVVSVRLEKEGGRLIAHPIRGKSGLISTLSSSDGYFIIERDCEGLPQGAEVSVYINQEV